MLCQYLYVYIMKDINWICSANFCSQISDKDDKDIFLLF